MDSGLQNLQLRDSSGLTPDSLLIPEYDVPGTKSAAKVVIKQTNAKT